MNYDKIAQNVIQSAVQKHLRTELTKHVEASAKAKATAWFKKNKRVIEEAVAKQVEAKMKAELPNIISKSVSAISIQAPRKRNSYY